MNWLIPLAIVTSTAATAMQRASPVGCYTATPALTYSAAGVLEQGDSAWTVVQLLANGKARRPLLQQSRDSRSSWSMQRDTLTLLVFDGLVGWRSSLTRNATGWRGTSEYLTDVIGGPAIRHPITLELRRCPRSAK